MSKFEPKQGGACRDCKWCDTRFVCASYPPMYRCKKLNTYVYCGQTICEEDVPKQERSDKFPWEVRCIVNDYEPPKVNDYEPSKVNDFEPINEHSSHWEHKSGEGWNRRTLVDDTNTIAEQKAMVRDELIGQALNEEAEQKKGEQNYGKPDEKIDLSRFVKTADLWSANKPTIEERLDLLERYLGISKHKMKQTVATLFVEQDKRLEALENRLTEIEGVLSSIGSPDWELRKKVEELEKRYKEIYELARLDLLEKEPLEPIVAVEGKTTQKPKEENREEYMSDKGGKANPFRCDKCDLEFKVISPMIGRVEHCPLCGEKPKRVYKND